MPNRLLGRGNPRLPHRSVHQGRPVLEGQRFARLIRRSPSMDDNRHSLAHSLDENR
jgi:hypothetical protein